jgi:hypothetical protein
MADHVASPEAKSRVTKGLASNSDAITSLLPPAGDPQKNIAAQRPSIEVFTFCVYVGLVVAFQ